MTDPRLETVAKAGRGEDDSRAPRSVLDVVMVISVSGALLVFAGWFFFFAGSPLPA